MARSGLVVVVLSVVVLSLAAGVRVGHASTDDFAQVAAGATRVDGGAASVASLLWARVSTCDGVTDGLERRQCDGVRRGRLEQLAGETFLVEVGADAVTLDAWSPKTRSASLGVSACLACTKPVHIDQETLYLVGPGARVVREGSLAVAPLHLKTFTFDDEPSFEAFKRDVVPRLRRELIVRVDEAQRWSEGGLSGVRVDVVAWRIYDPCTGAVLASKPAAAAAMPDKRACGGADAAATRGDGDDAGDPEDPEPGEGLSLDAGEHSPPPAALPQKLSGFQISAAMAPVRRKADSCFEAYGVAGTARFRVTVRGDGTVAQVQQSGDFVDTPTGTCITDAIKAVTFPKTQRATMTFDYPIMVQ